MNSDFTIVKVTDYKVFLVDNNTGGRSVTNDAEAVVAEVNRRYPNRRIIYWDSERNWDELAHDNGVFTDYVHYTEETP